MKRLGYVFGFGLALLLSIGLFLGSAEAAPAEANNVFDLSAMEFAEELGIGWNLGNSLDAYYNGVSSETAWNNPTITRELIQTVADAGFTTIRIPVTWFGHIDEDNDFEIRPGQLARVREVTEWALDAGMYAIVNVHHDGNLDIGPSWLYIEDYRHFSSNWQWVDWVGSDVLERINQEFIREKFAAVWMQIADYFNDVDGRLIFEGFNELHELWQWGGPTVPTSMYYLNVLNQIFVDTVRASIM